MRGIEGIARSPLDLVSCDQRLDHLCILWALEFLCSGNHCRDLASPNFALSLIVEDVKFLDFCRPQHTQLILYQPHFCVKSRFDGAHEKLNLLLTPFAKLDKECVKGQVRLFSHHCVGAC